MSREKGDCLACETGEEYCYHSIDEALGLKAIACFDDPEASYSFDMFCIWQRKSDGALFYGTDSGCSCPSPFEGVGSVAQLNAITKDGFESFKRVFQKWGKQGCEPYNKTYTKKIGPRWVSLDDETKTLDTVRKLLQKKQSV